jgi:hypothetical protein
MAGDATSDFGLANAMTEARAHGPDFVPAAADAGSGAVAIEIEVGSAIVRVKTGVELGLLGKVRPTKTVPRGERRDWPNPAMLEFAAV